MSPSCIILNFLTHNLHRASELGYPSTTYGNFETAVDCANHYYDYSYISIDANGLCYAYASSLPSDAHALDTAGLNGLCNNPCGAGDSCGSTRDPSTTLFSVYAQSLVATTDFSSDGCYL